MKPELMTLVLQLRCWALETRLSSDFRSRTRAQSKTVLVLESGLMLYDSSLGETWLRVTFCGSRIPNCWNRNLRQ